MSMKKIIGMGNKKDRDLSQEHIEAKLGFSDRDFELLRMAYSEEIQGGRMEDVLPKLISMHLEGLAR